MIEMNRVRKGWVGRAGSERMRASRTVGWGVKATRNHEKKRNGVREQSMVSKRG